MEIKLYQELQILIGPNRGKNSLGTQLSQRPCRLLTNSLTKQTRRCSNHTAAIKTKMQIHPEQGPTHEPGNRGARPVLPFFLPGSVILSTFQMIIKVINSKYIN
jgi:hypothetical protein